MLVLVRINEFDSCLCNIIFHFFCSGTLGLGLGLSIPGGTLDPIPPDPGSARTTPWGNLFDGCNLLSVSLMNLAPALVK